MKNHRTITALLAIAVIGAGAYTVASRDTAPPERTDLLVVGDALLFDGTDNRDLLVDEFRSAGYNATIEGYEGETIVGAHENTWPRVSRSSTAQVLVIALGTNDRHVIDGEPAVSLLDTREALGWWLVQAAEIPCVVIVGVNESAAAWGLDETGPAHNEMAAETAARFDNAHFVEWAPTADLPGLEAIFLGPAGRAMYRQTIIDGVTDAC